MEPLLASAKLLAARGDLAAAQGKIDRALSLQPKSIEAQLTKAEMLKARGDSAGALSVLDQMLTDQPGNIRALIARAELLIAEMRPDKAKADIDAVLKATPGNVQALYLMAVMQAQSKDYKTADTTLEKISAFIPRIPRAYFLQAVIKDRLGQPAQAEEAIRRYIARDQTMLLPTRCLPGFSSPSGARILPLRRWRRSSDPVTGTPMRTICSAAPMRRPGARIHWSRRSKRQKRWIRMMSVSRRVWPTLAWAQARPKRLWTTWSTRCNWRRLRRRSARPCSLQPWRPVISTRRPAPSIRYAPHRDKRQS